MKKYYIAYAYTAFNGKTMHDSNIFELEDIKFDNFQESMDEIRVRLGEIHSSIETGNQVVILSWQEL